MWYVLSHPSITLTEHTKTKYGLALYLEGWRLQKFLERPDYRDDAESFAMKEKWLRNLSSSERTLRKVLKDQTIPSIWKSMCIFTLEVMFFSVN